MTQTVECSAHGVAGAGKAEEKILTTICQPISTSTALDGGTPRFAELAVASIVNGLLS